MFRVGDAPIKGASSGLGGCMLRLISSQEASTSAEEDVLKMIYGGSITKTHTWVETSALLVTKCQGQPFGTYYVIVLTNDFCEDDISELDRLEGELGKKLDDCVVERERYEGAHPFFPGSQYFHLVTIYGG